MFGFKKKEKQLVKTFVNGVQQDSDELPVPKPADAPVQEVSSQPRVVQLPAGVGCAICFDFKYYADSVGVWHSCPRCNAIIMTKKPVVEKEPDYEAEEEEGDKPKPKSNLYVFRTCKKCGAQSELHRFKKKWKCEKCHADQEV